MDWHGLTGTREFKEKLERGCEIKIGQNNIKQL